MKKLILTLATVALLASCANKETQNTSSAQSVKQATIDSIEYANKQQRTIDSLENLTKPGATTLDGDNQAMIPLAEGHKKVAPRKKVPSLVHTSQTTNTPSNTSAASQPQVNAPAAATVASAGNTVAATPEKKKGLNNSAKGAIIGLGTGAAAGAIIGKENRGKGAIIGGVAGAIGGAVGGAILDHRKAKKAAEAARLDSIRQDSIRRSR